MRVSLFLINYKVLGLSKFLPDFTSHVNLLSTNYCNLQPVDIEGDKDAGDRVFCVCRACLTCDSSTHGV